MNFGAGGKMVENVDTCGIFALYWGCDLLFFFFAVLSNLCMGVIVDIVVSV